MFTLKVENKNGTRLELTQNESVYQIVNITGLNPPAATIHTSEVVNIDGVKYKSSKLQSRNIVLTIKINGDVEANRIALYTYFKTRQYCKIFYSNEHRNIYCEGYCETIDFDLFTNKQEVQISILCPNPYLFDLQNIVTDMSKVFASFEFPMDLEEEGKEISIIDIYRQAPINNVGEVETGIEITIRADVDNIPNPIIYNAVTGEYFKLNLTMNNGDIIVINTNQGKKSIKRIINGVVSNAINYLETGSTWFQLDVGQNLFTYSADENEEFLTVHFEHNTLFEGV